MSTSGTMNFCSNQLPSVPMARRRKPPGWAFGSTIASAIDAVGLTHQELADRVGVSRPAITQIISGSRRQISGSLINALARELNLNGGELLRLKEEGSPLREEVVASVITRDIMPRTEAVRADMPEPRYQEYPRNVPVTGTKPGGSEGSFLLNGEIVEYIPRPPGIANASGIFAIWLIGDTMAPRFDEGALLYIHPGRAPRAGDDVLIELLPDTDGSRIALVKRLVKRNISAVEVEQLNPPKIFSISLDRIAHIYKILTTAELMGI